MKKIHFHWKQSVCAYMLLRQIYLEMINFCFVHYTINMFKAINFDVICMDNYGDLNS